MGTLESFLDEQPRRWLVLGHSGAGKSTLALELGRVLSLPVVHLDQLSWLPGWREQEREVFCAAVAQAAAGDTWIIDGNYSATLGVRLPRAQAVIWLDYSLARCLWGIGRRVWRWRGRVRPDMNPGCPERLDWEFLWWAITHHGHSRRSVTEALAEHGRRIQLYRFTSPEQTRRFVRELRPGARAVHPIASAACR